MYDIALYSYLLYNYSLKIVLAVACNIKPNSFRLGVFPHQVFPAAWSCVFIKADGWQCRNRLSGLNMRKKRYITVSHILTMAHYNFWTSCQSEPNHMKPYQHEAYS